MKKLNLFALALLFMGAIACQQPDNDTDIEDDIEEVGEDIEKGSEEMGEDIEDVAEDIEDDMEDDGI